MSCFEGTPLSIALRDCQLLALAIVGIALELGIDPTVQHAADLGFIPVVVADACSMPPAHGRAVPMLWFARSTEPGELISRQENGHGHIC